MKFIGKIILRGLATILPLIVTAWIVWWCLSSLEAASWKLMSYVLTDSAYFYGIGILTLLAVSLVTGLLMEASLLQKIFDHIERRVRSIPLVKSIYDAFKDFFAFFSNDQEEDFSKAVLVTLPGVQEQAIGLITSKNPAASVSELEDEHVAVYIPMSYQLGGFTVFVKKEQVQEIDLGVQDAVRYVLTAGMSKSKSA